MPDAVTVEIADSLPQELVGFVLKSWLRSYQPLGCIELGMGTGRYYDVMHDRLLRLLWTQRIALARLTDEPDVWLGWACGNRGGELHYVYVKRPFRRAGFASRLAAAACDGEPSAYTFRPSTNGGKARAQILAVAERRGWAYRPHEWAKQE